MVIAVIGWGSLIWNPGSLELGSGWFNDGPELPVEFARQSDNGRLTLVVYGDKPVQTLWAELSVKTLEEARRKLGWRENCVKETNVDLLSRHIGWWTPEGQSCDSKYPTGHTIPISEWAKSKGFEGVVWTALPSRKGTCRKKNGTWRSLEESRKYLDALEGAARDLAFEYIRKTPAQIRTPYREAFEDAFPELKSDV